MVSIWVYGPNLFGNKTWEHVYDVSWAKYESMATRWPDEGAAWKATFKF